MRIAAKGSATDITIDINPKGTGVIRTISGYENNISDHRHLTNRGYILSIAKTFSAKQSFISDATNAAIRIVPVSGAPSSLSDGDIWYDSSLNKFRARENGASINFASGGGSTVVTNGNGTTGNSSAADLGGALNQNTSITGAGFSLSLGTSASRLSTFTLEGTGNHLFKTTSGALSFVAGNNFGFFSDLRMMRIYNGSQTPSYTGAHPNVALQVQGSTTSFGGPTEQVGLLWLPNTSTATRTAISTTPPTGGFIYDTDLDRLVYYDGSTWESVANLDDVTGATLGELPNVDVTGTTYTIDDSDAGKMLHFTNASGCLVTLPNTITADQAFNFTRNIGAGVITFDDDGVSTLEASALTLEVPTPTDFPVVCSWIKVDSTLFQGFGALGTLSGGGGGSGTVTSVALSVPSFLSVAGSPITTSGTLAVSLATQTANTIFAGPTTGGAAVPTFRTLVAADIPSLSSVYQPLDADLTAIAGLGFSSTSFLKKTAANTWALDTATYLTSITGTSNRISVSGSTIDIDSNYVGQSTISTVGVIGTGAWQGTAIGTTYGGTGLTALGTANQMLRVNAGATALEYFTLTAAGFGAWSLATGGTLTGVNTITSNTANQLIFAGTITTSATNQYYQKYTASLTADANSRVVSGLHLNFSLSSGGFSSTDLRQLFVDGGRTVLKSGGTTASENALTIMDSASNNLLRLESDGGWRLGSDSGAPIMGTANATAALSKSGRALYFAGYGPQGGTIINSTFTLASGSSTGYGIKNLSTINTTGSFSSGVFHLFYGKTTRTSVTGMTSFYGLVIDESDTKNGFNVAAPTAQLQIGAGSATANTAPIKLTTGTNLTTPEAGVIEYDNTFYMTQSDATRRSVVLATNSTKTTAGAPYTNDGYITVRIGGTDVKIMTTA